jgi:hypothetical protein
MTDVVTKPAILVVDSSSARAGAQQSSSGDAPVELNCSPPVTQW